MGSKKESEKNAFTALFLKANNDLKLETGLFAFIWFACYAVGVLLMQVFITFLELPDFSILFKGIAEGKNLEYITTLKVIQLVLHLFQYLIPAVLFAFLFYGKTALKQLYADHLPNLKNIFLGTGLVISIYPLISFIYYWNTQLLPSSFVAQNKLDLQKAFLEMNSLFDFALNLILFGLIAGLGEEFFFRGVLQKIVTKWFKNIHLGAIMTGIIFSLLHFQWEGFLPRAILGVLFCYLLVYSLSIWLTVYIHIFFNSIQVVVPYLYPNLVENINHVEAVSPLVALFSSFVFIGFLFIFIRANKNNTYIY